jgi:hypothetical protein
MDQLEQQLILSRQQEGANRGFGNLVQAPPQAPAGTSSMLSLCLLIKR